MMPVVVVARAQELGTLDAVLERAVREPAAFVLEGEPGIGKTTIWRQSFARAAPRGMTALACRPVQAEAKLAFASLADLLEPVVERVLASLPEPQRTALEVALVRATPRGTALSARAVASAALSVLRRLAEERPLLLAIDDAQWLDRASAEALAFALRRIGPLPIAVVAAVRLEDGVAADPLGLDVAFAGRIERVRLEPLGLSALHHVIRAETGYVFPRPVLRRIAESSAGNPLFAVELARAVHDSPRGSGEHLVLGRTLQALMDGRLRRLPADVRATLLVVAALSAPTPALVARTIGAAKARRVLADAEEAGIVAVRGERVRFAHPLLAASVYSTAALAERRRVHRKLAALVGDPEEQARHLALAAARPDETIATALDAASLRARRRGAPDAAAELQERAARLTPAASGAARRRRCVQAAEYAFLAGDRELARSLVGEVLTAGPGSEERSRGLHVLGRLCGLEDQFAAATRHLEAALAECRDVRARVTIRLDLGFATYSSGDLPRALEIGRAALADAEQLGDDGLLACVLANLTSGEFMAGLGIDEGRLRRALALEDRELDTQIHLRPTAIAGVLAAWLGRTAEAEELLERVCRAARERGEESAIPFLLCNLSRVAWLRGDLPAAVAQADEALVLATQSGSERMRAVAAIHLARARFLRGEVEAARTHLADARALIEKTGHMPGIPWLLASEGMLEMSLGDLTAAERAMAPLVAFVEANGVREPVQAYFVPDAVEVMARLDQLDRAEAMLDGFATRAAILQRAWAIAVATRGRALLANARGDLDRALAEALRAIELCEPLEMPFEIGRARLALGQIHRRRGERRLANEELERARTIFGGMGASLWVERVDEELRRVPLRRSSGSDLTPTEERVAALAASGRTNAEVARALFMSPKTVEANLSRIYGKLGIRSRAELGARMARRDLPKGAS